MHWLDPEVLPRVAGRVEQYTVNRHGDVDGVLLDDDRQVHVPPHLGRALEKLVAVGDRFEARYVKPRAGAVFSAVSVSDAAGRTLVDSGPPDRGAHGLKAPPAMRPIDLAGRVRTTLYAPRGEVCGAVLESGEQVRVDPKANADLAPCFARHAQIHVWGESFRRKGVTVIDVHEIAFSDDL